MFTPLISILVVNFNGKRYLKDCLDSIAAQVSLPHEVVLVDNCSSDDSAEYVERNHPTVRLIRNPTNAGFAAGNNLAAAHARGRYFLLINNDTILRSDLRDAIRLLDERSDIGAVGFQMLGPQLARRISTGKFPTPWRLLKFTWLLENAEEDANSETHDGIHFRLVDWIEGSFILTTSQHWHSTGGLDERYFMYVEDVDFCQRLRRQGLRVAYLSSGTFVHYGGYNDARLGLLISGYRRYHRTHSAAPNRWAANTVLTLGLMARLLGFGGAYLLTRNGKLKIKFSSCVQALVSSPW